MAEESPGFDNNEGMGGFEQGGYDQEAMHPTDSNWTRQSRFRIPDRPHSLWRVAAESAYINAQSAIVVDRNGELLVSDCDHSAGPPRAGRLFRISPAGEKSEVFRTDVWLKSPAIGRDGLIYLATTGAADSTGHKLYCLFPSGRINWEAPIGHNARCKPVLDGSGNVYVFTFGNEGGTLFGVRAADGTLNWQHEFGPRSGNWSEPFISQDGVIHMGVNGDRKLHAFDKSGRELWATELGQGGGTANIARDGTIYVSASGTLFALHADGTIKWRYAPEGLSVMQDGPAVDRQGNLYLNLSALELVSLSPEAQERWRTRTAGYGTAPPVIGRCGELCQQSYMSHSTEGRSWIEAYSSDGDKLWTYEMDGAIVSTVLAGDNRIYALLNRFGSWNRNWELRAIGQ